jgi:predicted ATPase
VSGLSVVDPDNKLSRALEGFELLLAAATALVRSKSARPALLDAYDDASDRLMDGLRGNGIPEQQLQAVHKALARLRLAFEESQP